MRSARHSEQGKTRRATARRVLAVSQIPADPSKAMRVFKIAINDYGALVLHERFGRRRKGSGSRSRLSQIDLDSRNESPGQDDLPATGPFGTNQSFANVQCVGQARKQLITVTCSMIRTARNGELAQRMIDPFKED